MNVLHPRFVLAGLLALAALRPRAALGDADLAEGSLRYSDTMGAQVNPGLLANELRVSWRRPLYGSPSPLLPRSSIGAYGALLVSPRGLRPSVGLGVQPLPFLDLGASYGATFYFASGGQSYPSPHAEYDSSAFSRPRDGPGGSYGLTVQQVTLSAALQAKVGRVSARTATRASRIFADPHDGDTVVYDPGYDVVVYEQGWVAQNDTSLGYAVTPALTMGVRNTLTHAWYPDAAYAPGEAHDNPNTPIDRLGPFALVTLFRRPGAAIETANLAISAQWYLEHRYRTGDAVSGAVPLLGITFTVSGDLLRRPRA